MRTVLLTSNYPSTIDQNNPPPFVLIKTLSPSGPSDAALGAGFSPDEYVFIDSNGTKPGIHNIKYKILAQHNPKPFAGFRSERTFYKIDMRHGIIFPQATPMGRTKNALIDALFRHSEGLDKWSHLAQSQYTIEQLVLQGKTVLFDITDIKAWKGMEELMMQGYKSLGKEFAGGLNKIHGRNPLKKQKYKESILAARDWLKKPIYEDVLKECQKDWGKTIDELVAEIFKKYNIQ